MSARSPTTKRLLREAQELAAQTSPDYTASPLETDLFEWHFTLRGPPAPSPFAGGIYHGRIVLPPSYPLKPPSFRFLTPTGRFEVNREICLSISGHHEESWQPAWGIRTALVAIRSFMDESARGQLGGLEASEAVRRRLAGDSRAWRCGACGNLNEETMREQEAKAKEAEAEGKQQEDVVPEELQLGMKKGEGTEGAEGSTGAAAAAAAAAAASQPSTAEASSPSTPPPTTTAQPPPAPVPARASAPAPVQPAASQTRPVAPRQEQQRQGPTLDREEPAIPSWIDKAIIGILAAIFILIWRRWAG